MRALLDNASNRHYITYNCANQLQLQLKTTQVKVSGLGSTQVANVKHYVDLKFKSITEDTTFCIQALVVQKIGKPIPSEKVSKENWNHLQGLQLADPRFDTPGEIDILLGADIFYTILTRGIIKADKNSPVAIKSQLGWLIGGGGLTPLITKSYTLLQETESDPNLEHLLTKFWEIEAMPETPKISKEENACESHFQENVIRNKSGKFVVGYPWKAPRPQLGESLPIAIRRFKQVEKRLTANQHYQQEYIKFMREYEKLGHMVEVEPPSAKSKQRCYLPHHFVLKDSTTTKLRVVFDASAKTSNGISLNDTMMIGPQIQETLANMIMRFRKHKVAVTGDIEKMYRQILIAPDDQEFQHIVWRESPEKPLKHYKLLTVTYGTASAPFLATRVLKEIGLQTKNSHPIASKAILEDFYMDDFISGAETVKDAIKLIQQVRSILDQAHLPIRKFTSNSQEVLKSLPSEVVETKRILELEKTPSVKTLGIIWNPQDDYFGFHIQTATNPKIPTKRIILSDIARLFDPIGWLSPVLIRAKILMQQIWKAELDWDEPVTNNLKKLWEKFQSDLKELETLRIPRWYMRHSKEISIKNPVYYIIGYSDASQDAYSAVVYLGRYDASGSGSVALVTSKTRVAPVKSVSLPKLELCGAVLLAELIPVVIKALKLEIQAITCFTDSTLTLSWIQSEPYKWITFIRNRVTKIQEAVPECRWFHVAGLNNPADIASRGIKPKQLIEHPLWWHGEPNLSAKIPEPNYIKYEAPLEFQKKTSLATCHKLEVKSEEFLKYLWNKISSLTKLERITAYIKRFINNLKISIKIKQGEDKRALQLGSLQVSELKTALLILIKCAQETEFALEIEQLQKHGELPKNSKILQLSPFLDSQGLLRVGGRLANSNLSHQTKYPLLLPRNHILTNLIIRDTHQANLHSGPQATLTTIQQKYWIIRARDAITNVINKCITCSKLKAQTMQQFMADLPKFRANPSPPFTHVGVDYAGPFLQRPLLKRSKVTLKAYLAVFICCSTRSIHLEVVSNATTAAFLAALRRFIARRGKPSYIYSDNGTNFVGANRELKELTALIKSDAHNEEVTAQTSKEGIIWKFNVPAAPHFGGLWEAGVRSVKHHLRRIVGNTKLTFEEFSTITAQIEAILNSRPLTPESNDPSDLRALTPGHFLIGKPLTAPPDEDLRETKENRLVRWQLVQRMVQHFWKRWSSEFITRMQQRPKWNTIQESITKDSLVLIKDENLPPLKWKLGRVTELHIATDGLVRSVTLRTEDGELKRPIIKLCLLPTSQDMEKVPDESLQSH